MGWGAGLGGAGLGWGGAPGFGGLGWGGLGLGHPGFGGLGWGHSGHMPRGFGEKPGTSNSLHGHGYDHVTNRYINPLS